MVYVLLKNDIFLFGAYNRFSFVEKYQIFKLLWMYVNNQMQDKEIHYVMVRHSSFPGVEHLWLQFK